MFNRYWRDYPWFLQVILFGLMVFTFVSFSLLVARVLLPATTGYNIGQIINVNAFSSRSLINAAIILQGISAIGVFLLPPLLFANLTHPRIRQYLSLKPAGKPIQWILVLCVWMGALPLFLELGELMKLINLGPGADSKQTQIENMTKAFLDIRTGGELVLAMFVMALIPAISEELFFRGVLLRLSYQKTHRLVLSGMLTSVLFALAHGTPYNYLPIFLAGALLCYIFYLTGSLFCGMLAHFVYNGSQVLATYIARDNQALKTAMDSSHVPVSLVLAGLVVFSGSLYLLWKNRTPLQPSWADNFTPQELDDLAKDETQL